MNQAAKYASFFAAFVFLMAAAAVLGQSLSASESLDWKLPCGLLLGSGISLGLGWLAGTAPPASSSCAGGSSDESSGEGDAG